MKKATNNNSMKQANRRLILDMIRREPISRADIATRVELTRASVTIITEQLINEGLIYESELVQNNVKGRSPVLLMLNPDGARFGGIHIEKDYVEVGIVNISGGTLSQKTIHLGKSTPQELLKAAWEVLAPSVGTLESVGICAPGPLDAQQGTLLSPSHLSVWHDVSVTGILEEFLPEGNISYLESIPNALALEEKYFGVNRGAPNFASLVVDQSTIGLGIVLNDQLLRVASGLGSELGHTTVVIDGLPCECGNHGCLEKYASLSALLKDSPFDSWHSLVDQLENASKAQELLGREAKYLSVALLNAVNILELEMVILKGDIAYNATPLCSLLNQKVAGRIASRHAGRELLITASEVPCSVRTAAIPAIHHFFTNASPYTV